jgi:2-oxoglutarate dehydrogenase E2 component (dihydrolipoamide succinyltransferase)
MKQEIKIPTVAESITEVDISEWLKADGEIVELDELIVVIDSDKASLEMAAEHSGKLEIVVPEGETVEPGALIGYIDTSVSAEAGASSKSESSSAASASSSETISSPAAAKLAKEKGIDPSQVNATGKDGRVTKQDVLAHNSAPQASAKPTEKAAAPSIELPKAKNQASGERETRSKMSSLRRKVASRLVMAQHTAAILTTFNEIDMSHVMELRSRYKESFEKKHDIRLGFMSFFTKAVVEALKEFPDVNSYIDGNDLVQRNYYDVSVAVSGKKGLVVPVIRDCDQLSLAEIEKSIKYYALKARDNTLSVDDMMGGGFTISNGGVFGSLLSTPILNPPQTGILGLHKIEERAVVVDGEIVIRPMMYVALSYDHRVIDGKQSVGFLVKIKEIMEDPARLLLEV